MSVTQSYKTIKLSSGALFEVRLALESRIVELKEREECSVRSAFWTDEDRKALAGMISDTRNALAAVTA